MRNSDAASDNTTFGGIHFSSRPGTDFSIGKANVNSATSLSFRNVNSGASLMELDSSGNLGVGVSPARNLSVNSGSSSGYIQLVNTNSGTGSSDGLQIKLDSGGAEADIINRENGRLAFHTNNAERMRIDSSGNVDLLQSNHLRWKHAAGGTIRGSIDADSNDNLMFYTGSSETERMRINGDGDILFGVTSLSTTGAYFESSSNSRMVLSLGSSTTSSSVVAAYKNPNGTVGTVSTNGSATAYNTSSDARLKDVTGSSRGLEIINQLNPVAYNWKADGKADEGLIAQEVEELVPNAVTQSEDGYYQMDYSKLVTHLVKAVQEQQEQIESLKSKIADLKGE